MRIFKKLSQVEKAIIKYLQSHEVAYPTSRACSFSFICHLLHTDKKIIEDNLNRLTQKKLVKKIENPKIPDNPDYILILEGQLYKFTDRWTILTSLGIALTTISTIILLIITISEIWL